jgi:hypothetical protein
MNQRTHAPSILFCAAGHLLFEIVNRAEDSFHFLKRVYGCGNSYPPKRAVTALPPGG